MIELTKSSNIPSSLARQTSYSSPDVITQLGTDFHHKCYICEGSDVVGLNVEHFIPHLNTNNFLKYDWNNLFYACTHCNNAKGRKIDLLNCIEPADQVNEAICHHFVGYPMAKVSFSVSIPSNKADNTVELLNTVFNSTYPPTRAVGSNSLRKQLLSEMSSFLKEVALYVEERTDHNKEPVIRSLSSPSAFAGFKRCFIKNNDELFDLIGDLIP